MTKAQGFLTLGVLFSIAGNTDDNWFCKGTAYFCSIAFFCLGIAVMIGDMP